MVDVGRMVFDPVSGLTFEVVNVDRKAFPAERQVELRLVDTHEGRLDSRGRAVSRPEAVIKK